MKSYAKIPRGLITTDCMSIYEKLVCMYLILLSGNEKFCYPSQKKIAEELSISRQTVYRAIKKLETAGFISVIYRENPDGAYMTNLYTVKAKTYEL